MLFINISFQFSISLSIIFFVQLACGVLGFVFRHKVCPLLFTIRERGRGERGRRKEEELEKGTKEGEKIKNIHRYTVGPDIFTEYGHYNASTCHTSPLLIFRVSF